MQKPVDTMNIQKDVYFVLTHNIDLMMNNNYKGSFKKKRLRTTDLEDTWCVPLTKILLMTDYTPSF